MPESGSQPRMLADWIESFLKLTEAKFSPPIFRKWAAITAVAGAMERRLIFDNDGGEVLPNLYVMLVAHPGIGKSQAITPVRDFWRYSKREFVVCGDDITKAGLLDTFEDAKQKIAILSPDRMDEYKTVLIAASEMSVLLAQLEQGFMGVLTHIWDNLPEFSERKRSKGKSDKIVGPQITIIGGAQPATLMATIPPHSWDQGIMARFIMIYCGDTLPKGKLTIKASADPKLEKARARLQENLTHDLDQIGELQGFMQFTPEATDLAEQLHLADFPPLPEHTRLVHYNKRRPQLFLKLCMISSASAGGSLAITKNDVVRAYGWMLEAEQTMPDVFSSMAGRSDADLLDELHNFVYKLYVHDKKPVHRSMIWRFLSGRATSDKINHILNVAVKSGLLRSEDLDGAEGTAFVPLPKTSSFLT